MTQRDRAEVARILSQSMTVGALRDLLIAYDDDCPVVFTCDYGDYGHTLQALIVSGVDEHDETEFDTSGYSHSGVALKDRRDDEDEDEAATDEPLSDRPEPKTVVVLS